MPVKVAEPKKLTTWVYNGDTYQGNVVNCAPATASVPSLAGGTQPIGVLCQKTEQATADVNGSQGLGAAGTSTARSWKWTYDQYGQVLTADGPRTDVVDKTTYTYYDAADADLGKRGNLATISNALAQVTQITAYDLNGKPLTVIDPNGITTTLAYDARQRLTSRTVGSEATSYQYDGVGQLTKVTLPDGSSISYTYDGAHRLTALTDALDNQIFYTLDAMGNRTKEDVKDPGGQLTRTRQRVFDALSRLAQDIGAQSQTTTYEYDANGNRTKVIAPLGRTTSSTYDPLNRLLTVTDPGLSLTRYTWDGQDRLSQVTDPRNLNTTYTVDGLGNRLQQQSPDTGTTSSTYDAAGNELTRTDAKGQVTTTQYDALNRPTRVTWQDASAVAYTWDSGSYGIGRLSKLEEISNGNVVGSLQMSYDAQGRLTGETRSIGSVSHSIGYLWNGGSLTGQVLPSGKQINYTRNVAGQIVTVALNNQGLNQTLTSAISYYPFGGIKSYTDGAGQVHNRQEDQDGRTSSYSLGNTTWLLSYDLAGRISGTLDGSNAANSGIYGYDAADRLSSATLPASSYGYGYDASGNRSTKSIGGATQTNAIDPASNRLQSVGSTPPKNYSYDLNGSITGDGSNQYAYDAKGRLVQATTAAGITQYRINALGQRVKKSNGGGEILYHYDNRGHLIAESDGSGTLLREYVWLDDVPLAIVQ